MNKEELKKHCEKKLKFANTPFVPDKEVAEHRLILKILKENEAYENMRKEANNYIEKHIKYETDDCINGMQFCSYHLYDFSKEDLLNILNKVGGSDE